MRVSQYLSISGSEYLSRSLLRSIVFSPSHSLSLPRPPSVSLTLPSFLLLKKRKEKKPGAQDASSWRVRYLMPPRSTTLHGHIRARVSECAPVFVCSCECSTFSLSLARARALSPSQVLSLSSCLPLLERETHKHRRTAPLGIDGVGADVCQGQGG